MRKYRFGERVKSTCTHGHSSGPIECRYLGPPHGVVKVRRSRTERAVIMILTHVKFSLAKPMTLDEATAIFERTAPKYKGREGLLRKTYLLSEDGLTAGAVYFWKDRASAERVYTDE